MTSLKIKFGKIDVEEGGAISCMSGCGWLLAVFRNPNIELWNVEHEAVKIKEFPQKTRIEGLKWWNRRLFYCSLDGYVAEIDIETGGVVERQMATSGPVWCIDICERGGVLGAGTEDGFVNIFITTPTLSYVKVLDRQEGRVLCLNFSACGRFIATGSIDSIRLWDVEKGHALQRINTGRSQNKETIVWAIYLLKDFSIVVGDSRGTITIYDGRLGVLKHKVPTHKGDVLTLKMNQEKTEMYAGGVDPTIVILVKTANDKWVKSHQRNVHFNDVLCMEIVGGRRLFSGGMDSDLGMSSFPPKLIVKYPNLNNVVFSKDFILIVKSNSLELYDGGVVGSKKKIATRKRISMATLNKTGSMLAYSTENKIKIFDTRLLKKIKTIATNASLLHFLDDDQLLINQKILNLKTNNEKNYDISKNVNLVAMTTNTIATAEGNILKINNLKIPNKNLITSLNFNPNCSAIAITTTNNEFKIYDYLTKKFKFQKTLKSHHAIKAVWGEKLFIYSNDFISIVEEVDEPIRKSNDCLFTIKSFNCNNVAAIGYCNDELVVLETNRNLEIMQTFVKKRFGF